MRAVIMGAPILLFACSGDGTDGTTTTDTGFGDVTSEASPTKAGVWTPTVLEQDLYDAINSYRAENGLPAVPFSASLSMVARTHATDLLTNRPHEVREECNLHSWSAFGNWTQCCYTPDHARADCMWDKPREITDYPGDGYEISAFGASDDASALALWKSSTSHEDVILNRGIWEDQAWAAMGVGADGSFFNVWFGVEVDPIGR
ncbi:MAG: hypothetical protein KTR31_40515 [Myxococcales bacterium]|nr:hypothetical protein [Myxococcales bacterium]